jgi:hypothetical protein
MVRRALPLVLIVMIAACGSPPDTVATGATAPVPPPVIEAPPKPRAWTEIAAWSGTGIKQTETFHTTQREWRIRWATKGESFPGAGILQLYVYNAKDELVSLAANKQGPGNDVSYVRTPAGPHYIQINSGNINYAVSVEEQR